MNKFEEAFYAISNFIRDTLRQGEGMETLSFRTIEPIVTLKQLVDRATPKKVDFRDYGDDGRERRCPCCYRLLFDWDKFCSHCGQALK